MTFFKKIQSVSVIFLLFFFSIQSFSQTAQIIFQEYYPNISKKAINHRITDFSTFNLKSETQKLSKGISDISIFETNSANSKTQIFRIKDLQKLTVKQQLSELKLILNNFYLQFLSIQAEINKYGGDSIECVNKYLLFNQYFTEKNYDLAYKYWSFLYQYFPMYSLDIYTKAIILLNQKIEEQTNLSDKNKYIDTLLNSYNQRIKYFSNHTMYGKGYILGRQAIEYYKLRKDCCLKIFELFNESISLQNLKSESAVLYYYVKTIENLTKKNLIQEKGFIEKYMIVNKIISSKEKISKNKELQAIKALKTECDNIFIRIVSCNSLNTYYQTNKSLLDSLTLLQVFIFYQNKKCNESTFLYDVLKKIYAISPSPPIEFEIAKYYLQSDSIKQAVSYFEKVLETEKNDSLKAFYCFETAKMFENKNIFEKSIFFIKKAIDLKPDNIQFIVYSASIYAKSADFCGNNDFEKACVFWLVVDKLEIAKKKIKHTDIDKLIEIYSKSFPKKEDIDKHNLKTGQKILIKCWINETTTIR